MRSKATLTFTLIMLIVHVNGRSHHYDTNWGDSDADWENTYAAKQQNTLAKPNLLDFNSKTAAKPKQAYWIIEMVREFIRFVPKGILIIPYGVPKGPVEIPRDEYNRTVRPWTARVPAKYLGKFPYNIL